MPSPSAIESSSPRSVFLCGALWLTCDTSCFAQRSGRSVTTSARELREYMGLPRVGLESGVRGRRGDRRREGGPAEDARVVAVHGRNYRRLQRQQRQEVL